MIWECYGPLEEPLQAMGSDFDFWPPRPWRPRCRCAGRPWGSAKNASMTKAVAISPIKLLNGHPLGTATTLVGHGGRYYDHLYMLPRRPPRGHPRGLLRGLRQV